VAETQKASATGHDAPEIQCAEAWVKFADGSYDEALDKIRKALTRNPDLDGGYYVLGRALFAAGRYQEVLDMMEEALDHAGENYNTTIPIHNALGALGKKDALKNYLHREVAIYEGHVKKVPEDARARVLLAGDYAIQGRFEDAKREADMAMALRPDDTMILYNTACAFCAMNKPADALAAIRKAWEAGFRDPIWTRQDPDLAILHGDPEFERLYPAPNAAAV
jgi:tetratricopeptide (TPR) repeat protein